MGESKHIQKFKKEQRKQTIFDLLEQKPEISYAELAEETGMTIAFVKQTIQERYSTVSDPEQIIEMRQKQAEALLSQGPTLHKQFRNQANLLETLVKQYEETLSDHDKTDLLLIQQEFVEAGYEEDIALEIAKAKIAQHWAQRDQVSKEMDRTAKLFNAVYRTIVEHEKRLSDLVGLDAPKQHEIAVKREDVLKIDLAEDMRKAQEQMKRNQELQQPIQEAEVVEEEEHE